MTVDEWEDTLTRPQSAQILLPQPDPASIGADGIQPTQGLVTQPPVDRPVKTAEPPAFPPTRSIRDRLGLGPFRAPFHLRRDELFQGAKVQAFAVAGVGPIVVALAGRQACGERLEG